MVLDKIDSKYIDKKLQKTVDKALSMFQKSSEITTEAIGSLSKTKDGIKSEYSDLDSVSDLIAKALGKDLTEKDQVEFKLGLVDLIDSVESKYIEDSKARSIINKVILALLMRFKAK